MNILIADIMHPSLFDMFKQQHWEYLYAPDVTRSELINIIGGFDGLVVRSKTRIDQEIFGAGSKLKFVARAGAGLDLIDLDAAQQSGVKVFHAGKGNRDSVAEHVVGMLLSLFNNINKANAEVKSGIWDREGNRGVELMGRTVGLIGYGNNGSATAQRLHAFGCKVLAYDKYLENYGDLFVEASSMEEIFTKADVLSLHIPLTDETRLLVCDSFISRFKNPFYLINASRGETAEIAAIVRALRSGKIKGACLDVLENEKLHKLTDSQKENFDYLAKSDQVILTPHVAGWTHESYVRINRVLVEQIKEEEF